MLLCLKCSSVYQSSQYKASELESSKTEDGFPLSCLNMLCRGNLISVDEVMIPVILTLNQKGYVTDNCCAGHHYRNSSPYIHFKRYIPENKLFLRDSMNVSYRFLGNDHSDTGTSDTKWYIIDIMPDGNHFRITGILNSNREYKEDTPIAFAPHQRIYTVIRIKDYKPHKDIINIQINTNLHMNEFLQWSYDLPHL